jgi:hypothetical protein
MKTGDSMTMTRESGREEYADMRHRPRSMSPLTMRRLQILKHSKCSCGSQATVLHNESMLCSLCSAVEDSRRRARHMSRR